jgi:hypothetical protein
MALASTDPDPVRMLDGGRFVWTIDIPDSNRINVTPEGIGFEGWVSRSDENQLLSPTISKLIYTRNGPPVLQYDIRDFSIPADLPAGNTDDLAKGADLTAARTDQDPLAFVQTSRISTHEDHQIWSIQVNPARYHRETRSWRILYDFELNIETDLGTPMVQGSGALFLNAAPARIYSETLNLYESPGKMKLYCLEDGIYRIYFDSLAQDDGFPQEGILSDGLNLRYRGESQPIHVADGGDGLFGEGDHFDFIGKQNYFQGETQYFDPFSDISVYWLDWDGAAGLRFIEESGALQHDSPVRPESFWDVAHVEKDSIFDRLGQVDTNLPTITRDHYFWSSVNSGQRIDVPFFLPDPARGSSEDLQVSIGLHGLTYSDDGGESGHTLFAFINDNSIGEANWTQQEEYTLVSPDALNLSHNILSSNGNNTLSIFAPVSTEPGNYDRIVLNWMKIGYEHSLTAHNDALNFRKSFINPNTTLEFEISGFSDPELVLYKEGLSKVTGYSIRENWDSSQPEYSLVFQDLVSSATPDYWAASHAGLLQPVLTKMDTAADLRQLDGDMIVITTPFFVDGLEAYAEFKRSEGWNPVVVSVVDVYDEFNYGINSPFAIRSFLQYAQNHWPSHPEYVLLVGDAISNPRATKRDTQVRNVPTFYMQTYGWGAAEADYWYSLLSGDDYIPDMNVGRIPCSSMEDLEISMEKLIRYGSAENYGSWQNELIGIAGFETTFKSQSESLLRNTIPNDYMPSRIFIDRDSEGQIFWGDTDSLVALWNQGKILINFLGHGGGAVWADRSLFVREDIQYFDPEIPPAFVTSMTCFTASFAQVRGLGEVVLTESPAGAIGWFGSSGVGWIINDYLMVQPLLSRLLSSRAPVGEVINQARMDYFLANSGYDYLKPSMLFQYNYLGDPTTRLLLPEKGDLLLSDKSIYSSSDQLSFEFLGDEAGQLKLLPIDADNHPWFTEPRIFDTELSQTYLFDQPDLSPNGSARTIYTLDRGRTTPAIQGFEAYGIESDWFDHRPPLAEDLSATLPIPISVRYHGQSSAADSMVIQFTGGTSRMETLVLDTDQWILSDTVRITASTFPTNYYFKAYGSGALLATSRSYQLALEPLISIRVEDIQPGNDGNQIGCFIEYSLSAGDRVMAQLDYEQVSSSFSQTLNVTKALRKGQNKLFIQGFFGPDTVRVQATLTLVDQNLTLVSSALREFQTNLRQIIPGIGLTRDGVRPDSIRVWGDQKIYSEAVDTSWIAFRQMTNTFDDPTGLIFYRDSLILSIESASADPSMKLSMPSAVFAKQAVLPIWERLIPNASVVSLPMNAHLALGVQQDFTAPSISMMIEGQLFFDGDYLLDNSRIDLLAEDAGGFTWNPSHVNVSVDGNPVEISFGDTTASAQILSLSAHMELGIGEHVFSYQLSDAFGNWSDPVLSRGVVTGEARIIDYGNFPNPFEGETLIIYELTQPLDDLVIEIFTLSGYKLHKIDAFNARVGIPLGAIGYHEVPWNGRDMNEDFVANGIYFYRIRGKSQSEDLLGPVGKMVKNR